MRSERLVEEAAVLGAAYLGLTAEEVQRIKDRWVEPRRKATGITWNGRGGR